MPACTEQAGHIRRSQIWFAGGCRQDFWSQSTVVLRMKAKAPSGSHCTDEQLCEQPLSSGTPGLSPASLLPFPCLPEAATKYNKAEQLTLRDRFARLNTHSIAKKTTRLSRLLMHEAGIVAKVRAYPLPAAPPRPLLGLSSCTDTGRAEPGADTQRPMLSCKPLSPCRVTQCGCWPPF